MTETLSHPAFRTRTGLGPSAGTVWVALQESSGTKADLITRIGKSEPTIRRALIRLRDYGLARQGTGGEWAAMGDLADLAGIADETGATIAAETQRKRHKVERRIFYAPADDDPMPDDIEWIDDWDEQ